MRRLLVLPLLALALAACSDNPLATQTVLTAQTAAALDALPADAQAVGMFDAATFRDSPLGDLSPFTDFEGEAGARFDEFVRVTGLDPQEDLDRFYVGMTDIDDDGAPYMIVYGTFDREAIDAYIRGQEIDGLVRTEYRGVYVYTATEEDGDDMAFALVSGEMAAAAPSAALSALIDRAQDGTPGLSGDAEMTALIRRAAYPDAAWMVARGLPTGEINGDSPAEQAARFVQDVVVSSAPERGGLGVTALAVTRAGADPEDVASIVRGGLALARGQAAEQPELMEVLDDVRVETDGDAVEIRAFLPAEFLAAMRGEALAAR